MLRRHINLLRDSVIVMRIEIIIKFNTNNINLLNVYKIFFMGI